MLISTFLIGILLFMGAKSWELWAETFPQDANPKVTNLMKKIGLSLMILVLILKICLMLY